tara:strand:- start:1067 stop:1270 length:204 start_codon:yes stop_codon:yes gene_type:complete
MKRKNPLTKYLRRVMNYFIDAIIEKISPSFINKKNKYKWIGVHSMSNPNPNHKENTIVKKFKKNKDK